ncbi:hypothetical protein CDD83_1377 [Cordyceps sp. RAO-2017]|nr:hypothetical protein CDD83_1377 [Cordyceps sp. RAO-2017]
MVAQTHRDVLVVAKRAQGWTSAEVWNGTTPEADDHESGAGAVNSLYRVDVGCSKTRLRASIGSRFCEDFGVLWTIDSSPPRVLRLISLPGSLEYYLEVDYCLSEPYSAPCELSASSRILLSNLVCAVVGWASSCLLTYACWANESCQSIGDAIQAFMRNGDLIPRPPAKQLIEPWEAHFTPARSWDGASRRLGHVVDRKIWLWTYIPLATFLIIGSVLYTYGLRGAPFWV